MNLHDDFERWWKCFPRKVGKLAAQREYERARKKATADELIEGIARYLRAKPDYADLCHPITFLRQGRWMDEAQEPSRAGRNDRLDVGRAHDIWLCPHTPSCGNPVKCALVTARRVSV